VEYNASAIFTYNLGYGGATMDSSLVAPWKPDVSSIADQIQNEWFPTYASKPSSAPWASENALFALFDGINDVGNSWWKNTTLLNAEIFAVYHGLVDSLYYAGARNFAFLNVPPVDRAPQALANSVANQAQEKEGIAAWNNALMAMAKDLKSEKPDVNVFTVDANQLFNKVLDNPSSFLQTSGYKNTTAYCAAYQK
jgi:phospholipase/lecithinase/hemolysin